MCERTTCRVCGRPASIGCEGNHVEDVLGDVPLADRCHCGAHAAASLAEDDSRPPHAEGPGHLRTPNWSRAIPDRHRQVGVRHSREAAGGHKPGPNHKGG
jgi:hypothetical protein